MKVIAFLLAMAMTSAAIAAPIMTKKDNGDGTVTYEQGGKKSGSRETVSKEQGKEIERKAKEDGIKVKDITPKK